MNAARFDHAHRALSKVEGAQAKIRRMRDALSHREGDRVPVGEFFWTGFMKRCQAKWGKDFDPYRHFDLDYIVINPNMDPRIRPFEVLKQDGEDIVLRTGFGATIRRSGDKPMPSYESFSVQQPERMPDFGFDDPADPRRFFQGGDDQLNCVGDALARNLPSWEDRMKPYLGDFAIFGSVCEPYEYLWRIVGSENALIWMAESPDQSSLRIGRASRPALRPAVRPAHAQKTYLGAFVDRIGKFLLALAAAEIKAGQGRLSGMYIWGDVAYRNGMLFSPARWREMFKPHVKALIDLFHSHGLMVIYHGCGNPSAILDDFVEMELDGFNPLEAKADLDVVELKRKYAGKLAFVGNIDVRVLETGKPDLIKREVLYKLRAAKGGGWVFQSDHSVSSAVSPESYELAIRTLREFGKYPLPSAISGF